MHNRSRTTASLSLLGLLLLTGCGQSGTGESKPSASSNALYYNDDGQVADPESEILGYVEEGRTHSQYGAAVPDVVLEDFERDLQGEWLLVSEGRESTVALEDLRLQGATDAERFDELIYDRSASALEVVSQTERLHAPINDQPSVEFYDAGVDVITVDVRSEESNQRVERIVYSSVGAKHAVLITDRTDDGAVLGVTVLTEHDATYIPTETFYRNR